MQVTWDVLNPSSRAERILVLGPSLGGNAHHQWAPVADKLAETTTVVFVELPGHALTPVWDDAEEPTLEAVSDAVAQVIREVRRDADVPVFFAGLSISGATGLHLARDHFPDEVAGVAVLCSVAQAGDPVQWLERARDVEDSGTQQLIEATEQRWFTTAFRAQHRSTVESVMEDLAVADDRSYAQLCRALAAHDVRADLEQISCPLLLIAVPEDAAAPVEDVEFIASHVRSAEMHVIPDSGHQVTLAQPGEVATKLLTFMDRVASGRGRSDVRD